MSRGKILFAHDHPESMEAFITQLICLGFEILIAVTLCQAQLKFMQNPDIIIAVIDGYMPSEKGEESTLEATLRFLSVHKATHHKAKLIEYSLYSSELCQAGCIFCPAGDLVKIILKTEQEILSAREVA